MLRVVVAVLADLGVIAFLAHIRGLAWHRGRPAHVPEIDVPEWWWQYGTSSDFVLFGPDAGNWASNARALLEGGHLDLHRLPVYGWATAGMSLWTQDVVFGGHMANHLASTLTALVTYWIGRMTSGRGPALLAAFFVATSPDLLLSQQLYGVDPVFGLSVVLLVAFTIWGTRGPAIAIVFAGMAAGATTATHYLGLLFPVPCALMLLFHQGRWQRRIAGPLILLAVAFLTFRWFMEPYPNFTMDQVSQVYSEGVLGSQSGAGSGFGSAVEFVTERIGDAPSVALERGMTLLRDAGLPWALVVAAFWLGVLGLGLPPGDRHRRLSWDWRWGLMFLVLIAPVVLLEAARAPFRYRYYAYPLLFLLVGRGIGSMCAPIDLVVQRFWRPWPAGWIALAVCLFAAHTTWPMLESRRPGMGTWEEGWHDREVGEFIVAEFGAGGPVITRTQGIGFHAERMMCPRTTQTSTMALADALEKIEQQCTGSGDIPYVLEVRSSGAADAANEELDAWVQANFQPVKSFSAKSRSTTIYAIPRSAISLP